MDFTSRTFTSITINGRTYKSLDEMPPDDRRQYEELMSKFMMDRNNNGIPDFAEAPGDNQSASYVHQEMNVAAPLKGRVLDSPLSGSVLPYRGEPQTPRGITIHLSFGSLIALAVILAIGGAVVWWVLTR